MHKSAITSHVKMNTVLPCTKTRLKSGLSDSFGRASNVRNCNAAVFVVYIVKI